MIFPEGEPVPPPRTAVSKTAPPGCTADAWVLIVVAVKVGGVTLHPALETALVSNVTAPLRANSLPLTLAPVVTVMLVSARILPAKFVPVPRVAELPTCQN